MCRRRLGQVQHYTASWGMNVTGSRHERLTLRLTEKNHNEAERVLRTGDRLNESYRIINEAIAVSRLWLQLVQAQEKMPPAPLQFDC